jgi:hypothetical protein
VLSGAMSLNDAYDIARERKAPHQTEPMPRWEAEEPTEPQPRFSIVDRDTGEVLGLPDRIDVADDEVVVGSVNSMVKAVLDKAFEEKRRLHAMTEASWEAKSLTLHIVQVRSAVQTLMGVDPAKMAECWVIDERTIDAVALLRDLGQQLLDYADSMKTAKPSQIRAVK